MEKTRGFLLGIKLLFAFLISNLELLGQDYYNANYLRYSDHIYNDSIHTVRLHESSWELSPAMIKLGADQTLLLSFDDFRTELKNLMYTVVHCDASWNPTDLNQNEYIEGFIESNISNFQYSFNTFQRYIHYEATFPSDNNFKFLKSGNYLLKVYEDSDTEKLLITKRFLVYEDLVAIRPTIGAATSAFDKNYKQELDFTVVHDAYRLANPYANLKVVVTQNDRWDNAVYGLKPLFVKDSEVVYDYDDLNVFKGGNEYRHFDIKSLRYYSDRIAKINYDSLKMNHVYLKEDDKRSFRKYYSSIDDINGKFTIKATNANTSEVEADYVYVHFFLPYSYPESDGNMYVFGALSNWQCTKDNQLQYNKERKGYEGVLYLKQGYYNYEYVFLRDGEKRPDVSVVEGTHFETGNDYAIYIYHQAQGTYYDRLVGVKRINSVTGAPE